MFVSVFSHKALASELRLAPTWQVWHPGSGLWHRFLFLLFGPSHLFFLSLSSRLSSASEQTRKAEEPSVPLSAQHTGSKGAFHNEGRLSSVRKRITDGQWEPQAPTASELPVIFLHNLELSECVD